MTLFPLALVVLPSVLSSLPEALAQNSPLAIHFVTTQIQLVLPASTRLRNRHQHVGGGYLKSGGTPNNGMIEVKLAILLVKIWTFSVCVLLPA